jgi:dolichol-phosphate mannosyltransferase
MLAFSKAIGAAAGDDGQSHPSGRQATFYWLLAGLAFGGALLSKYTAVMLAPSLGLFLLLSPRRRGWLLRPQPWLALAAGLLVFAPVLVWNAQHEWASFLFQSTRTVGQRSAPVKNVFEFWLLQLLILGPIPLVVFGAVALRGVRRRWMTGGDVWNLSLSFFLPLFAVFVLASFKTEVHINWTAPAFLSLVIGAAAIFQEGIERRLRLAARYWRVAGWCVVAFAVGAAGLGVSTRVFGIPKALTPSRMAGWRQLAAHVNAAKAELERVTGQDAFVLGTDRYNMAAELGFYTRDPGNCVNSFALGKQGLGFHYWTDLNALENRPAVAILTKPDERTLAELNDHFDEVGRPVRFDIPLGGRTRTMWLVDCRRYHAATLTRGEVARSVIHVRVPMHG